ncbi:MAG: LysM peptidoglycan-binding domain-containing protein [Bacteroidota bacterium]
MILSPNKCLVSLLLGMLLTMAAFSQEAVEVERSVNKVILEGKVYYIHVVKPGQTLFAISKAYHISQKEIAVENPGVVSGIQIGQALKIPVEPNVDEEIDTSDVEMEPDGRHTHKVMSGETFYSISRQYGITELALREANSMVRPEALKPGQRLLIPQALEEGPGKGQEPAYDEEGFAYHKVNKRETLYSIARFYEVDLEDIKAANPELGWGGPQTGQVIRIPQFMEMQAAETTGDSVLTDGSPETYFYEELTAGHDNRRRTYRIAYFIPFDFQKSEPLDSLLKNVESVTRRNRIIERFRMEQKTPQSVQFLEFFQGSLLALDSMRQTGMKLDVRFYDTRKSIDQTLLLLEKPDMEKMDLIFGPFYAFNLEIVAEFAKREKIPIVTPFFNEMVYAWDNPYLFQLSPSLETGYREVARLVASKHDYNIVYVREEDSLDMEKHSLLREMIYDGFDDYRPEEPVIFKELVLTLEHTDEIIHSLSTDRKNLVIVPTGNEALASRVVSSLYYRLKDFDIEIIGTPNWTEFSSIDYRYYHELSLMFYNPFWMDYLDPKVDDFLRRFRDRYYTEPRAMTRKGINYGITGYDMTFYFVNALKVYGPRFILSLDDYHPELVLDSYHFSRVSPNGGYENSRISFYQFHPDMSIRRLEIPELPRRQYFFQPMDDGRQKYLHYDPDR